MWRSGGREEAGRVSPKIWDFSKGQPWGLVQGTGHGQVRSWAGVRNEGHQSACEGVQALLIFVYFLEAIMGLTDGRNVGPQEKAPRVGLWVVIY